MKHIALFTFLLSLACPTLFAQQVGSPNDSSPAMVAPDDDAAIAAVAPNIIFSNLTRIAGSHYNTAAFPALPIAGRQAGAGQTEQLSAVRFMPKTDVQAKVLMAAIGYISGKKLVKLGIYSDDPFTRSVGTLLPGAEGSTTQIPDLGGCCQLVKVILPGEGVRLSGGVFYWLVGSADEVTAPNFSGAWQVSNLGSSAQLGPPLPWDPQDGHWPAALIRGTRLQTQAPMRPDSAEVTPLERSAPAGKTVIFSNLGPASDVLYFAGTGLLLQGKDRSVEVWRALPFTPRTDVHAQTLAAAIGWVAGTRKVNLGIYSDSAGLPGTLLPGGQSSTTDIPNNGVCCELATVRLRGAGVALKAKTQYWLVASPDNVDAPDFEGDWQISSRALGALEQPEEFINWTNVAGEWLAAEIRGTNP